MSIEDKYLEAFEWCFKNSKITETKKKESLIHIATGLGLDKLVEKLIQKGVDINCQDNEKNTPLHIAAEKGHVEIAKKLIENKADVNCLDENQQTPLKVATFNGHFEMVKCLIQCKANVNLGESLHWTNSLHAAIGKGYTEMAKLLIDNGGANVNAKFNTQDNKRFVTHLLYASNTGHLEIAKLLISKGAIVNINNIDNVLCSPLLIHF